MEGLICTENEAYSKLVEQNYCCAISGVQIGLLEGTACLEKIDFAKDYTKDNIQWIHKKISKIKQNLHEGNIFEWAEKVYFNSFKTLPKVCWDLYFLSIAKIVSVRSIDPSTKHGCVIVDVNNRIVSVGYNGPVNGIDDEQVPLTRPDKYNWILHSEENAVLFSTVSLEGCKAYITGFPCPRCFRMLAQKGIVKIVYGSTKSNCISSKDYAEVCKIAKMKGIILEEYSEKIAEKI